MRLPVRAIGKDRESNQKHMMTFYGTARRVLSSYRREWKKCHSKWEDDLPHKRYFCLRWEAKPL